MLMNIWFSDHKYDLYGLALNKIHYNNEYQSGQKYIGYNSFDEMEKLYYFHNIKTIWGHGYVNLGNIKLLPDSLTSLHLYNCKVLSLPKLPSNLKKLRCSQNMLKSLPELPSKLEELWVDSNEILQLPNLPESLKSLFCNHNPLFYIPKLPKNLESLRCQCTNITELPELPKTLDWLMCSNTKITYLPNLPEKLRYLECFQTELTDISTCILNCELAKREVEIDDNEKCLGSEECQCMSCLIKSGQFKLTEEGYEYTISRFAFGYEQTPFYNKLQRLCGGDLRYYLKYKSAVDTISKYYLEAKYNPAYAYCRKILEREYYEMFPKKIRLS